ncbi:hypothetical protein L596_023793 [Steinernema carpocapsae]|uniref:Uncharacterized protein n=1 Tax=Steinernema carpocapsae TaxID=34508 RepID=A0A4U5MES2_STECR|nr:hypothetical protein L596_023793 [Steinernema carpocapsae]
MTQSDARRVNCLQQTSNRRPVVPDSPLLVFVYFGRLTNSPPPLPRTPKMPRFESVQVLPLAIAAPLNKRRSRALS